MKKGIIKSIVFTFVTLLLVMPFSFTVNADGAEADDPGYIAAVEFFRNYGLQPTNDPGILLNCQSSSQTNYCSIYESIEKRQGIEMYNVMKITDIDYTSPTAYTTSNRLRVTKEPLYLVFLSNVNWTNNNIALYPQSGYEVSVERVTNNTQTVMTPNGFYLITLKLTAVTVPSSGTVWASLALPGSNTTRVIPFYKGPQIGMPDNLHRIVFGTSQTYNVSSPDIVNAISNQTLTLAGQLISINGNQQSMIDQLTAIKNNTLDTSHSANHIYQILNQGNNQTSSSVNNLNQSNSDLSDNLSDMNDLEQQYNQDFNAQINQINFSDQLSGQTGFLSSASFVVSTFNTLITGNPLSILIIIVCILYVARKFIS